MSDSAYRDVALDALRRAARACGSVQRSLITADTLEKKDRSPVTVADFASQAIVCGALAEACPGEPVVAEEDAAELRAGEQAALLEKVRAHAAEAADAELDEQRVLAWIDHGGGDPGPAFWTLDPIDGTKGFLRGGQYAIALGRIEGGLVTRGALACPNLSLAGHAGVILWAERGGGTWAYPLADDAAPSRLSAGDLADPAAARFCESVESGHSDQGGSAAAAQRLGITQEPVRMDSQAKYAAVAAGDAQIYLRLPTDAGYREKIWDHAAGKLCVEEAGGRVTDVDGRELDFSRGATLQSNRGVVATNGPLHDRVLAALG